MEMVLCRDDDRWYLWHDHHWIRLSALDAGKIVCGGRVGDLTGLCEYLHQCFSGHCLAVHRYRSVQYVCTDGIQYQHGLCRTSPGRQTGWVAGRLEGIGSEPTQLLLSF